MDLQVLSNVTSLKDCMDSCASFTWQARPTYYQTQGCVGAVWANGRVPDLNTMNNVCFLKANITLETSVSLNNTAYPGYDGAVLLYK